MRTGRIYRVTAKGTADARGLDLAKKKDADLVKLQLHKNDWHVRHARRILHERATAGKLGRGTHAALKKILDSNPDVTRKLRALCTLHVTGGAPEKLLLSLLDGREEHVRAWAVRLLCENKKPSKQAISKFAAMAKSDVSPVVRLALAAACQRMSIDDRWAVVEGLVARAEDDRDHNIPMMVWYATEPLVAADRARALKLAGACKLRRVREFIARRATAK